MRIDLRHRNPPDQVTVGIRMICVNSISYLAMHVFFFGVPRFSLHTWTGQAELGMAAANFALVALGAYSIYRGIQDRRP
jgi:hypothetical protein